MNDTHSREFWGRRQHVVVGCLVHAGAFPDVDPNAYERELQRLVAAGLSPHVACIGALEAARYSRAVSACEAHPW